MQGSSEKCRKENGSKMYFISTTIIYVFCFTFAVLSYLAYTVNVNDSNQKEFNYMLILKFFKQNWFGQSYYWL